MNWQKVPGGYVLEAPGLRAAIGYAELRPPGVPRWTWLVAIEGRRAGGACRDREDGERRVAEAVAKLG